ncbi:division/cell wall cluster transcriptional repressor MraZ [Acidaminococcus intestini]|uniref:division/cell wall cluster transcriptional repressor MraZ n=1 Tax=Acidaminococcus intestini TaxID=187327 RepID=UPI0027B92034|nr:division/cell wall cluster transcriptional repressor MraZ [Acidaminococcus intestini]
MLMGEYEHSVDAKGRLFVPAKLRSELGKTFVITKGVDGCIDVYPMDAWDRLQQSFAQQTLPKKKARDVSRFLFGNSMEVEPDKQGRILLPQTLRKFAQIEGLATIIGTGTKVEIWDTKRYEAYSSEVESDVAAIVEDLEI